MPAPTGGGARRARPWPCSPTGEEGAPGARTPSRPSEVRWRPAPTASSSTCGVRLTACSSSTTTPRSPGVGLVHDLHPGGPAGLAPHPGGRPGGVCRRGRQRGDQEPSHRPGLGPRAGGIGGGGRLSARRRGRRALAGAGGGVVVLARHPGGGARRRRRIRRGRPAGATRAPRAPRPRSDSRPRGCRGARLCGPAPVSPAG